MKTVHLPIYDENGMALHEELHVSVEILQALARTSVIYKDHVKVVPNTTPEQEIEVLDRIVHGLTRRDKTNPWREYNKREHIGEFAKSEQPVELSHSEWRAIPFFKGYRMNHNRMIVDETNNTVGQERGAYGAKVLMKDSDGLMSRMSVDFLFKTTFPEFNQ